MTTLSQTILEQYQVRKNKKQKTAFIERMQEQFPELQVQKGGFAQNRNLILGDIDKAKVVITAHYDTCAQLPFPNFIAPKAPLLSILYSFLIVIPMIAVMFLLSFLLGQFITDFWFHYCFCLAIYFVMMFLLLSGPANKNTANDNTSGVITLCKLYAQLTAQEKETAALVFFDNEESGLLGSAFFKKKYRAVMNGKLLINLDCVSDGDSFLIASSKSARKNWGPLIETAFQSDGNKVVLHEKAEKVYYPSDQVNFTTSVAIAALKHKRFIGYYMDRIHTRRDTIFDEKNIDFLTNALHKFIECL